MQEELRNKITVIIKTFNRLESLTRLLQSLDKLPYRLTILIADDSNQPYSNEILKRFPKSDIQYHVLPYDSGLSAGRNMLLEKVTTPYFLLCDDDFYLHQSTDLQRVIGIMEENRLDIAGGAFMNYIVVNNARNFARILLSPSKTWRLLTAKPTISRYIGHFVVEDDQCTLLISNRQPEKIIQPCDLVNNFFIGETQRIREMGGWNPGYKLGEHEDFFFRARQKGLRVAYVEGFATGHYPAIPASYRKYRERSLEIKNSFIKESGLSTYREIDTDSGKILFNYNMVH